jgi:hypothetical protein
MKKGLSGIKASDRITRREFVLILLLLLVVEGYLLVNYLLIPKWNEYNDMLSKVVSQKATLERLKTEYEKKADLEARFESLGVEIEEKGRQLPPYASQEDVILTVDRYSEQSGIKLELLSFGGTSAIDADKFAQQGFSLDAAGKSKSKETVPDSGSQGEKVVYQDINIGFSGTYNSLYSFLESLENHDTKLMVTSLSLQRMRDSYLSGSMSFKYLGYMQPGDDSTYELQTPDIDGKKDPFIPYPGYTEGISASAESEAEVRVDPDFLMIINSYLDNASKIILGEFPSRDTEVFYNANAAATGKFVIEGSNGDYTYSYTLGNTTHTGNRTVTDEEGIIRLEILSRTRRSESDNVAINFEIENNTDTKLELIVRNDDEENPRFILGNVSGEVLVK